VTASPPDILACERRVAMRNHGHIDPLSLEDYVAKSRGYLGLERALKLGPEGTLEELRRWGLRDCGGHGRSLAVSWDALRQAGEGPRCVVLNAVDPDTKAPIAGALLGGDPHSILEGLMIAAYAVGASRCYIAIDSEHTDQIAMLHVALGHLRDRGLLGARILGSDFACDVSVDRVAGSLVLGEETALLRALENRQALPELSASDEVMLCMRGVPVMVETAENLAKVSAVMQEHPTVSEVALGDGRAVSTKVLAVSGEVVGENTIIEIPLGTTIEAVLGCVAGAGGDPADIKAVQFGGPTGRFFAGTSLRTPITYEDLDKAGSSMRSGGLEVFGRGRCAVEMARDVTARLHEESCGKCVFCREGSRQLVDMLDDLARFQAQAEQPDLMRELAHAMKTSSICSIGREASVPLLSAMELFDEDFRSHLEAKRCLERGT